MSNTSSPKQDETKSPGTAKKVKNEFFEIVKVALQALALALIIRSFLFQPFTIPSSSMVPTLLVGDYLFVSKFSYGYSKHSLPWSLPLFSGRIWGDEPKRGDVAVFKLPSDPSIDYIKRVIGLPGDKVQVMDGIVYLNGKPIKRETLGTYEHPDGGLPTMQYRETLDNGVSYITLDNNPHSEGDNTSIFEVPEGHYFMMGDNRDNSLDSRFGVGFVPYENLVGPAKMVAFSVSGGGAPLAFWNWPSNLRSGRWFVGLGANPAKHD